MAISKLLLIWLAVSIALVGVQSDSEAEDVLVEPGDSVSPLKLEIEQLRSQISHLESSISDKAKELKVKDDSISVLEKLVVEKSAGVAALQTEVESLKKKAAEIVEEQAGKAHATAGELEKEVKNLRVEVDMLTGMNEASEARASEAEEKLEELNSVVENLEKTNEDVKRKLQKTERALQVAEEELMRVQLEATSKSKVLNEVNGAWLPPWLAVQIARFQDLAAKEWNEHGKPTFDVILQKASEKSVQAQSWAEPHLETVKTKWIPAVNEKWVTFTTTVSPHVQTVSTKSTEVYEVCRTAITPHFVKVLEFSAPYVQEVKKLCKPYVDQVATAIKPHVEKVSLAFKPYTKRAVYAYGKSLESATTYHHQVQGTVLEKLKSHELTKPLATKELVWFMASALLALPIFLVYTIFSTMFCKKPKKPSHAHASNAHRRPKRRHADK